MAARECSHRRARLLAVLPWLAACGADGPAPAGVADIDPANASYARLDGFADSVRLTDGRFEDRAGRVSAYLSRHLLSRGDLDGDGTAEAAVVLVTSAGESAPVTHLAVLQKAKAAVDTVATYRLGEQLVVRELEVRDGAIRAMTIEHGLNDPACCPSQRIDRWFTLVGASLEPTREAVAGPLGRTMGFVSWDDSGARFTSCDAAQDGAVLDGIRRQSVRKLYDQLAAAPGEPVFFDLEGRWLDTAAAGLAAPEERTLEITGLYRIQRQGFGCELALDGLILLAFGSEPAWRLEVRHDGARLTSADRRDSVVFAGDGQLAARQFEFDNERYRLRLSYLELPCREPVSGRYFSHTVEFTIGDGRFAGCAVPGRQQRAPL